MAKRVDARDLKSLSLRGVQVRVLLRAFNLDASHCHEVAMAHPPREARLKPECAGQYPGLAAGVWHPAASIAAYLLTRQRALGPADPAGRPARAIPTEHFEFRGGSPGRDTGQSRAGDS